MRRTTHTIRTKSFRRPNAEELAAGASRWAHIPDGVWVAEVYVEVDEAAIARELGAKAVHSRGQRAREIGGLVAVRVLSKRKEVR